MLIDHVKRRLASAIHDAKGKGLGGHQHSLCGLFRESQLSGALDTVFEAGVIVVCAVRNLWKEVIYTARYNRCITMGCLAPSLLLWGGSQYGRGIIDVEGLLTATLPLVSAVSMAMSRIRQLPL